MDLDEEVVASQIGKIHDEYVSVIQYHNENSLSSVLAIAYLSSCNIILNQFGNYRQDVDLRILYLYQNQSTRMIIRRW